MKSIPPKLQHYWDDRTQGLAANNLTSQYAMDTIKVLWPVLGEMNLDIGCGFGRLIPIYEQAKVEYVGIELDQRAARFTKKHFQYGEILIGDMRYLPFRSEAFDSVISVGTAEHVPEIELALYEHLRVIKKKSGRAIALIPALFSPFIAMPTLRAIKRRYNGRDWQIHFGSRYTMRQLRKIIQTIHGRLVYGQHIGISLPGRAELLFHSIDRWIGNAFILVLERDF